MKKLLLITSLMMLTGVVMAPPNAQARVKAAAKARAAAAAKAAAAKQTPEQIAAAKAAANIKATADAKAAKEAAEKAAAEKAAAEEIARLNTFKDRLKKLKDRAGKLTGAENAEVLLMIKDFNEIVVTTENEVLRVTPVTGRFKTFNEFDESELEKYIPYLENLLSEIDAIKQLDLTKHTRTQLIELQKKIKKHLKTLDPNFVFRSYYKIKAQAEAHPTATRVIAGTTAAMLTLYAICKGGSAVIAAFSKSK